MLRKDEVQFGILSAHEVELELESKKIKAQEFVLVGHPSWESENLNEIIQRRRIIDFHSSDLTTIRYLKHFQLLPKTLPRRIYAKQSARILWESSPEIQTLVKNKETILISGMLDVKSGKVTFDEPFQP